MSSARQATANSVYASGRPKHETETEDRELAREAEVREHRDRGRVVICLPRGSISAGRPKSPGNEALDKSVNRVVDDAVEAGEQMSEAGGLRHRLAALAPFPAVETLDVEVDSEHERQGHEGDDADRQASSEPGECRAQGGVNQQVGLGVEVATKNRDAACQAGQLAVGVVEHRLQLQQDRRHEQIAAG